MTKSEDARCFLCHPDPELVYRRADKAFAMVGFGPLLQGYSVIGTRDHSRAAADLEPQSMSELVHFTERLRNDLISVYGSCLISEHGRVPVCRGNEDLAEPHCYHAHFLVFPGCPNVVERATGDFVTAKQNDSLVKALELAGEDPWEYFLLSPTSASVWLLTTPKVFQRQYTRHLVSSAIGMPSKADWRDSPDRELALSMAIQMRKDL